MPLLMKEQERIAASLSEASAAAEAASNKYYDAVRLQTAAENALKVTAFPLCVPHSNVVTHTAFQGGCSTDHLSLKASAQLTKTVDLQEFTAGGPAVFGHEASGDLVTRLLRDVADCELARTAAFNAARDASQRKREARRAALHSLNSDLGDVSGTSETVASDPAKNEKVGSFHLR